MGRKLNSKKFAVLPATDSTTNPTSAKSLVSQIDIVVYEITVDAGVIGELIPEFSNEAENEVPTWKSIPFSNPLTINGATDTEYLLRIENAFKQVRLRFEDNAGAGNISAWYSAQSVGA